jgi:hypothetical protein
LKFLGLILINIEFQPLKDEGNLKISKKTKSKLPRKSKTKNSNLIFELGI